MEYYGYAGKILYADLSNQSFEEQELDEELVHKYIGGLGISSKLLYDLAKPGIDPLSPENPLIYGAGPFVGLPIPGFPRAYIVSKSPQTGLFAESGSGNSLGIMLRYAGYDHLVITGRANKPVYLVIDNDRFELRDASSIWGMGVLSATDAIRAELGEGYWVSCIGPAGERLVRFACIIDNKHSMSSRTGLGAVMGSKNLKAVAVRGTKGIRVWDRKRFLEMVKELRKSIAQNPLVDAWRRGGMVDLYMKPWSQMGLYIAKNYREAFLDWYVKYFPQKEFVENVWKTYFACHGCVVGCKGVVSTNKVPPFKLSNPWGTPSLFAACGARSWEEGVELARLANEHGLDAFSTIHTAEFAIELFEKGILTNEDTEGVELDWSAESVRWLMEKIVRREGIGDVLAEGVKEAAKRFGGGAERYAVHIKGLEPTIDLRGRMGVHRMCESLGQLVDPRGAHHARGYAITYLPKDVEAVRRYLSKTVGVPQDAVERICGEKEFSVPRLMKWAHVYNSVAFSLGMCLRPLIAARYNISLISQLYEVVTGIEKSPEELLRIGERIWNIQRLFNVREGASRADDMPPPRMMEEPLAVGDKVIPPLSREEVDRILDEYYDECGWDLRTGAPTPEKCRELGLVEEAKSARIL